MKELFIIGAGEFAKKIYASAYLLGVDSLVFVVESTAPTSPLPNVRAITEHEFNIIDSGGSLFVAIGNPLRRRALMEFYSARGWNIPSIVHPRAIIAPQVTIEAGVSISPGCIIEAGCTIGMGAILDIGVLLDHGCRVPPFAHLENPAMFSSDKLQA